MIVGTSCGNVNILSTETHEQLDSLDISRLNSEAHWSGETQSGLKIDKKVERSRGVTHVATFGESSYCAVLQSGEVVMGDVILFPRSSRQSSVTARLATPKLVSNQIKDVLICSPVSWPLLFLKGNAECPRLMALADSGALLPKTYFNLDRNFIDTFLHWNQVHVLPNPDDSGRYMCCLVSQHMSESRRYRQLYVANIQKADREVSVVPTRVALPDAVAAIAFREGLMVAVTPSAVQVFEVMKLAAGSLSDAMLFHLPARQFLVSGVFPADTSAWIVSFLGMPRLIICVPQIGAQWLVPLL